MPGRRSKLEVVGTANEALRELSIDPTSPVDPIDAIRKLDLELGFFQLGNLLGAIVPERGPGTRPGVMLTTERRSTVQRFTAAHEIGHWYLDQDFLSVDLAMDTDAEVLGSPTSLREKNAQFFASHFLMPLPLVSRTASKYGVKRNGSADPLQAYSIARDMNVSYQAAVIHLNNCHFIGSSNRASLLDIAPMEVKRVLGFGRKPTDSYANVWSVHDRDATDGHLDLNVYTSDDVVIRLPENRTTGQIWMLRSDFERTQSTPATPAPLAFGSHAGAAFHPDATVPADRGSLSLGQAPLPTVAEGFNIEADGVQRQDPLVGRAGERHIIVNADAPGQWIFDLVLASPFGSPARWSDELQVVVNVHRSPEDEYRRLRLLEVMLDVSGEQE